MTPPSIRPPAPFRRPGAPTSGNGRTAAPTAVHDGDGSAQIFDSGYRRYEGVRRGEASAVLSLWIHTMQRIMGLRRSARHKILPFVTVILAYLPAIAFIGILALLPLDRTRDVIPTYSQYYSFISAAILLFVIFCASEALCPDRRHRSLSLYLASPLTRDTYLAAKAAAVGTVLTLVTTGPLLLLLLGYVLQSHGPHGPVGVLIEFVRILGAGVTMAGFYTAFSLAISSLTDRKGFATGASLIVLMGSQVVTAILVVGFGLPRSLRLLNLNFVPYELSVRILGGHEDTLILVRTPTATVALVALAWTVLFALFAWARYQRLQVTR